MNETQAKQRMAIDTPDQVVALLGIYAGQVSSYTTLLWQVPALSLTAQSFLLTIALTNDNRVWAKVTASALSAVISASSYALMHDQRGHAINHGELAMRLSMKLDLRQLIDIRLNEEDGVPGLTNANSIWTWHHENIGLFRRAGLMYAVWKGCMVLFLIVDAGILYSVVPSLQIRVAILIALGVLVLAAWLTHLLRSWQSGHDRGDRDAGGARRGA